MPIPGSTQALIAAFAFGIVVNAASAAVFLFVKGNGTTVFKDGPRLVLVSFLASAALWAQVDFIATIIDPTSRSGCQIAVVFVSAFDQVARVSLEQYLLWAVNDGMRMSAASFLPQGLLFVRFILGAFFVGLQRPLFSPVCVQTTQVLPVAITVVAVDFVLILAIIGRMLSSGLIRETQRREFGGVRAKGLVFTVVAFAAWTGASVPMLLGMSRLELILKTAIPAAALSVLVAIITGYSGALVIAKTRTSSYPPEAPSPRHLGTTRDLQSRDLSTSDSDYPPSRYEDLKATNNMAIMPIVSTNDTLTSEDRFGGNGVLPTITRPIPGQALAGIGGLPVQGQLFPPLRTEPAPPIDEVRRSESKSGKTKRGIFDFGRGLAAGSTTKMSISNPIIQDGSEQNPLNKIPTVDLATAARQERERRDMALQRSSSLIAKRPAPQPPSGEALRRAQSIKRKEVSSSATSPGAPRNPSIPAPSTDLLPKPWSSTTSAALSPGIEDVRRRSPRQPPQSLQDQQVTATSPPPQGEESKVAPRAVTPPRPQRPETVISVPGEPVTPASESLMPTIPSPGKPALSRAAHEILPASREQSASVDSRLSILPRQASVKTNIRPSRQRPPSIEEEAVPDMLPVQKLPTSGLPRNPRAQAMKALAKEAGKQREQTVMFVNNIEYNDPVAVQNIVQEAAQKAAKNSQLLEKGLVRDNSVVHRPRPIPRKPEKDRPLFPAEPSPNQTSHKRNRSAGSISSRKSILRSNPGSPTQLPPLPLPPPPKSAGTPLRPLPNDTKSMTFDEKMSFLYNTAPHSASSAAPSTKTSKPTSTIPDMPPLPAAFLDMTGGSDDENSTNRSTKTSVRTQSVLEIDEIPRAPMDLRNTSKFSADTYAVADEVGQTWLPGIPSVTGLSYDGRKRQSSPILPLPGDSMSDFSDVRTRDEEMTNWGSVHSPVKAVNLPKARQAPKPTYIQRQDQGRSDGKEVMVVMLDSSVEYERDPERESWLADGDMMLPQLGGPKRGNQWHRRVGDECPTFSARKETSRARKMPPPTPLLLGGNANKNTVIIRAAEPSPLESPQHAYETIQAQLKMLDQPSMDSIESVGRRQTLLENLEKEMGMQEVHWQEMQHDIGRDSMSTVKTSPSRDSLHEATQIKAARDQQTTIAADRRANRRARMQTSSGPRLSPASGVAQAQYLGNQTELVGNSHRKLNFMSISKAQLGSPSPPDTDESDDDMVDSRMMVTASDNQRRSSRLWNPTSPIAELPTPSTGLLWTPGAKQSPRGGEHQVHQETAIRATQRKAEHESPAPIESSTLWEKTVRAVKKPRPAAVGLWDAPPLAPAPSPSPQQQDQQRPQQQKRTSNRPLTQRPPRRSRRVTLLPDIVESPKPLPDKRGTLGIFQFPWGERSDTATIQTRPSQIFMAMPGTMASGGPTIDAALEARSKRLEAQEYSSSFFDDYDEEIDDDVSDIEDGGSDDGFDETTLWEIASLLKSDQVPSKDSLFSTPSPAGEKGDSSIVGDYTAEISSDGEDDDAKHDSIVVAIDADSFPMPPRQSALLHDSSRLAPAAKNSEQGWRDYLARVVGSPRRLRHDAEPEASQNITLWNYAPHEEHAHQPASLWTRPVPTAQCEPRGLFSRSHKRTDYRTTGMKPAALDMKRKPRLSEGPLPEIVSSRLWKPTRVGAFGWDWLAMTTVQTSKPWIGSPPVHSNSAVISSSLGDRSAAARHPAWWESKQSRLNPKSTSRKLRDASYPNERLWRHATVTDWDAALEEAITLGNRPTIRSAFSGKIEVAANASVDAPVAGSTSRLWSKPTAIINLVPGRMWQPGQARVGPASPQLLKGEDHESENMRRRRIQQRLAMSTDHTEAFEKSAGTGQGLWKRSNAVKEATVKDWLDDSTKRRFKGIQFRY